MSEVAVNALFVERDGVYPQLLGIKRCWYEERDARTCLEAYPVVAHPPCQLWVNMAAVNWKRYGKQRPAWYPGGDDGGCFASALASVRKYGGVLEHPAESKAWARHELIAPSANGWSPHAFATGLWQRYWVCEVWQSAYGHRARKRTWLLYCGKRPPFELNWAREPGTHQVGWFDRNRPTLSKREASATPRAFAQELIRLAEWSRGAP
jgi:hypothetical protein